MTRTRRNITARIMDKVTKTDTCWLWTGATFRKGYGNVRRWNAQRDARRGDDLSAV